jgi:AraC-like DNA-binding protein
MIGIDGEGLLRADGVPRAFGPRHMIVADANLPLELSTPGPSARIEILTSRRRLGSSRLLLKDPVEQFDLDESYWRTIAALVVTILSLNISNEDAGFAHLKSAIESSIVAGLVQSRTSIPSRNPYSPILTRSYQIIEARFSASGFTSADLAKSLSISRAHMHRAFASISTTPYQVILERRTQRATELLEQEGPVAEAEIDSVAKLSGFNSARAMRRSLRQRSQAAPSARRRPDSRAETKNSHPGDH